MAKRFTIIDRRDGFNLCNREALREPYATQKEAQNYADYLNSQHPAKPYLVTQEMPNNPKYYRRQS